MYVFPQHFVKIKVFLECGGSTYEVARLTMAF